MGTPWGFFKFPLTRVITGQLLKGFGVSAVLLTSGKQEPRSAHGRVVKKLRKSRFSHGGNATI